MGIFSLVFWIALLGPEMIIQGRPQTRDVIAGCNVTAEERSARPAYPDPAVEHKPDEKEGSRVIFPGPSRNSLERVTTHGQGIIFRTDSPISFVPNVPLTERGPSCAEGSTFCEETDNYPRSYISHLLSSDKKTFRDFFGQDIVPLLNISQRIDASDESPLCPSLEQVVYPKTAQNKDDKWLYIINQDEFVQGIRVEKCIKEVPCALSDSLPIGYKTTCRQKYIYRKLVSLNDDGRAITDSFRIPSCCACHFRAPTVSNRFGMSPSRTRGDSRGTTPSIPKTTSSAAVVVNRRQPKS